ncbi:MAG: carboxyl transferase domain-containing protein, partial [Candidatus Hydrogenedentales bacterium]
AHFIELCSQRGIPLIFLQNITGFMVGRKYENEGIARHGAKMVTAVAATNVPKITVLVGGSFGAGNYALCGKAYDPRFLFAWPCARYAVMGAGQASDTLFDIMKKSAERDGKEFDTDDMNKLREIVKKDYEHKTDIRYGAARGWIDAIIAPHTTRQVLITALSLAKRTPPPARYHTGVLQT